MNCRQILFTFDTKIFGPSPWKNPEGITSKREIFYYENPRKKEIRTILFTAN